MDRKYIRKKIQEHLKNSNISGVGKDVFCMRSIPSNIESLPIILLYPKNETITKFDEAPRRYIRGLSMMIELITTDNNDECLTDEMDDLTLLIEEAIEKDIELKSCIENLELQSVVYDTAGEGDSPVGSATITYLIEYITEPNIRDSFADFNTAATTWKPNGHEDDSAQDVIELNP